VHYWLVKSEPDSFSWDQHLAQGIEPWTGVRNHSAKKNLQAMRTGDLAFFTIPTSASKSSAWCAWCG